MPQKLLPTSLVGSYAQPEWLIKRVEILPTGFSAEARQRTGVAWRQNSLIRRRTTLRCWPSGGQAWPGSRSRRIMALSWSSLPHRKARRTYQIMWLASARRRFVQVLLADFCINLPAISWIVVFSLSLWPVIRRAASSGSTFLCRSCSATAVPTFPPRSKWYFACTSTPCNRAARRRRRASAGR